MQETAFRPVPRRPWHKAERHGTSAGKTSAEKRPTAWRFLVNVVLVGLPPLTALGIETALAASAEPVRIDQVEVPEKVISLARDGQVDLVIVDPHQPTLSDGLKFCRALKEVEPPPYLMALSCLSDRQAIMYCLLAGIDSFVSRDLGPDRFASAVRSTLV